MSMSVARAARPGPLPAPGNRQQRRASPRRNTARQPSMSQPDVEPQASDSGIVASAPTAPASPLVRWRWRRWVFLANTLANLVFIVLAASGMHIIYYVSPSNAGHAPLFGALLGFLFWGAMIAGTLASALIALGRQRAYYRLLLNAALFGVCYCGGYLGLATTIITLRLGAGFLDPLILWQLVATQALFILSARGAEPPSTLHLSHLPGLSGLFAQMHSPAGFARSMQRFHHAARAFGRALLAPEHED